ncbi:MAG: alanine dehydrogenase [Alphaproteobacteria bacterium]|jgi:alanine dehydrogenase|nr:alanine dehydrogenase [Alphaproteobacteria bacterium]
MIIGVLKEIKDNEKRVALSPSGAAELVNAGHVVLIESNAAKDVGYDNDAYLAVGAKITENADELFAKADLVVKVKEPQPEEISKFREKQILFSYLHLAAEEELTRSLIKKNIVGISYETVTDKDNNLPLLKPMSEVAGKIATQVGAATLQKNNGGKGILLGGVTGVPAANVLVIGGGVVGASAAEIASGMGANVVILDKSVNKIEELNIRFGSKVRSYYSNAELLERYVENADLIVGAVLVPGTKAPKLVSADLIKKMARGSVIVDVAIDQGGCFATSKPTTHSNPTYEVDGVVHYCVTNMPAAVARTASKALENSIMPYILKLANLGYKEAFKLDKGFLNGLNIYQDKITVEAVAKQFSLPYADVNSLF